MTGLAPRDMPVVTVTSIDDARNLDLIRDIAPYGTCIHVREFEAAVKRVIEWGCAGIGIPVDKFLTLVHGHSDPKPAKPMLAMSGVFFEMSEGGPSPPWWLVELKAEALGVIPGRPPSEAGEERNGDLRMAHALAVRWGFASHPSHVLESLDDVLAPRDIVRAIHRTSVQRVIVHGENDYPVQSIAQRCRQRYPELDRYTVLGAVYRMQQLAKCACDIAPLVVKAFIEFI